MDATTCDRRVRRTKRALRQGLAQLLKEKTINDISVKELTELADIHRGTFYLHYRDIYDLQEQIENEIVQEFLQICNRFSPEEIKADPCKLLTEIFAYLDENVDMCMALLGPNGDFAFVNKLERIMEEKCLQDWMQLYRQGGADADAYAFFSSFTVSGCIGVLRKWMEGGMQVPSGRLAKMIEGMTLYGIGMLNAESPTCPAQAAGQAAV